MTEGHLGERIHDLLDGRLSRGEAHEAMAHLSECDDCSARWQELRDAREALHSSQAGIDMRFTEQLLNRERMAEIARGESKHRARAARGRDRRPATIAVAAIVIVAFTLGAAYVAGAPDTVSPKLASLSASGVGGSIAVMGPDSMDEGTQIAAWVHPDWQASGLVPIEARVERHNGAVVLVASLLVGLEPIVITEQHGHLSSDVADAAPRLTVGGVDAFLVNTQPVQLVWQSGRVVIAATCSCAVDTLVRVVAAFPSADEPGVIDRIATGLGVFAGALTGH